MAANVGATGLIFCSLVFGLAIERAGERGRPLLQVFRSTLDVVLILLSALLWLVAYFATAQLTSVESTLFVCVYNVY